MKKLIFLTLLVLTSIVSCKKDDDSDTKNRNNLLALYVIDQTSGNCAAITKNGNTYAAYGYAVPKGGCNEATLGSEYTTEKTVAKQKSDEYYNALIAVYNKAGSSCDGLKTSAEGLKNLTTAESIASSATNSTSGCTLVTNKVVYCKDQASVDNLKKNTRYVTIGSVKEAMKSSYEATVAAFKASASQTGFTEAKIALLQPFGAEELKVLASAEYYAYGSTFYPPAPNCAKAILDAYPNLKNFFLKTNGKLFDSSANVSDIIPVSLISCGYGSGFQESQYFPTTKQCNQTFEQF